MKKFKIEDVILVVVLIISTILYFSGIKDCIIIIATSVFYSLHRIKKNSKLDLK